MFKARKIMMLLAALLISSQAVAKADFEYDFAPSQWTYSETTDSAYGPTGTLTNTQMELTSANYSNWSGTQFATPIPDQKGSYSIKIPTNVDKISFNYQYSSGDIDGSYFDMPQYSVDGVSTDLVAIFSQIGTIYGDETSVSGTKTIDVSGKQGKLFSFDQLCNDCVLGSGKLKITGFNVSRIRDNSNIILSESIPTITSDAKSYTCKPGTYSFLQYGITKIAATPESLVYTLIINGNRVSSLSSDNWTVLSKSAFDTSDRSVNGTASTSIATWQVDGANAKSARCEVLAYQGGATALAYSGNS